MGMGNRVQAAWHGWKPQGNRFWGATIEPACRRSGQASRGFCAGAGASGEAAQTKVGFYFSPVCSLGLCLLLLLC